MVSVDDDSQRPDGRRVIGRSGGTPNQKVTIGSEADPEESRSPLPKAPAPAIPDVRPPVPQRETIGSSGGRPVTGRGNGPAGLASRKTADSGAARTVGVAHDGANGGRSLRPHLWRRFRRLRRRTIAVILALVVLAPMALLVVLGWWQFSQIPKVDVLSSLTIGRARSGTNYLLVGIDSREGIDVNDPNSGAFIAGEVSGSRTDTIMILHMDGSNTSLASIPRDLWVKDPASGQMGRINSTFAAGPANLVEAVKAIGIPVDHYAEINFGGFASIVDAVGGITVDFPYPARDGHSGLAIASAGPNNLDGTSALAFVRSRYYEELVDGKWRTDPTADVGRTERQRDFMAALTKSLANERNPIALLRMPSALGAGLRLDTTVSYPEALRLAWTLKDATLTPVAIPVTPRQTSGGALVLELESGSAAVIDALAR